MLAGSTDQWPAKGSLRSSMTNQKTVEVAQMAPKSTASSLGAERSRSRKEDLPRGARVGEKGRSRKEDLRHGFGSEGWGQGQG